MKAWLIYRREDAITNESYIKWFIMEAKKQQIEMKLIFRDKLTIGIYNQQQILEIEHKRVQHPDFVIVRTMEPILQKHFENMNIPTYNHSSVASICNHKALTYMEINKLGVPVVPTYFLHKQSIPTYPPLPFPFVIKSATGRGGKNVYMIDNQTEWEATLPNISASELVAQSIENIQLGKDIRVFVIGKEIIAAVLRHNEHNFRANFKLGGKAIPFSLNKEMEKMVQTIISHFDFGLVGIDFLINKDDQLMFNEIEDVVGSRILSKTSDINLLERYISFIKKTL